jgi:hypothetical protein
MTAPVDGSGEDPTWTERVLKPSDRGLWFEEAPFAWWPLKPAGGRFRAGDMIA